MAKRKKSAKPVHEFLTLEVTDYEASTEAGISWEVRDAKWRDSDTRVYKFDSALRIESTCLSEGPRFGNAFEFTIYAKERDDSRLNFTLGDCHVLDENHHYEYKRIRGKSFPVYNIPKGVGYLQKVRGEAAWSGYLWLSQHSYTHMLVMLAGIHPLYLHLHELRADRHRHIASLSLSNKREEDV